MSSVAVAVGRRKIRRAIVGLMAVLGTDKISKVNVTRVGACIDDVYPTIGRDHAVEGSVSTKR